MTPGKLNLTIRRGVTFTGVSFTCRDADGNPVNLAGWVPFAEMRKKADSAVVVDFAPVVLNAAGGVVSIPAIAAEDTADLPLGDFYWDLLMDDTDGVRNGPYLAGKVTVQPLITQPE